MSDRWFKLQKVIIACWALATLCSFSTFFVTRDCVGLGLSMILFASCVLGLYADVSKYLFLKKNR